MPGFFENKRNMGLVCMLVNILAPFFTSFIGVGIGGMIYGTIRRAEEPETERFFKNGLAQIIISAVGFVLFFACTFMTLGLGIVISWMFWPLAAVAAYIWSIFDAVEMYRRSQE
ncbi:MAG: hypothetical protein ABIM74_07575 [candidate division WOR-3 bacterium]